MAYAGAAIAHAGPPERDTRGIAISLGVDESAVGAVGEMGLSRGQGCRGAVGDKEAGNVGLISDQPGQETIGIVGTVPKSAPEAS